MKTNATPQKNMHPELDRAAMGRDVLTTNQAARLLNRSPQTLRKWACKKNGPITPVHIFGRLGWRVSDIGRLLAEGTD